MALDHVGKTVAPEHLLGTHALGRLALPWFAGIVASRLAARPELGDRYLPRLLVAGLAAQPAFAGLSVPVSLNVMFTLAGGVLLGRAWHPASPARSTASRSLSLVAGVALGMLGEFGLLGAAIVPTAAELLRRRRVLAAWLVGGAFAFLANSPSTLEQATLAAPALAAGPLALVWLRSGALTPRLAPAWFFYAFYAAHLWVLWAWLDFV
jgi:hypothetical protein